MMLLPSLEDLNRVSGLMYGLDFIELEDKFKPIAVGIAQQAVLAYVLDDIPTQISINLAETAATIPFAKIIEQFKEIDGSLQWLQPISEWFEKSRLYEP